jgi:hypothetical protein
MLKKLTILAILWLCIGRALDLLGHSGLSDFPTAVWTVLIFSAGVVAAAEVRRA